MQGLLPTKCNTPSILHWLPSSPLRKVSRGPLLYPCKDSSLFHLVRGSVSCGLQHSQHSLDSTVHKVLETRITLQKTLWEQSQDDASKDTNSYIQWAPKEGNVQMINFVWLWILKIAGTKSILQDVSTGQTTPSSGLHEHCCLWTICCHTHTKLKWNLSQWTVPL